MNTTTPIQANSTPVRTAEQASRAGLVSRAYGVKAPEVIAKIAAPEPVTPSRPLGVAMLVAGVVPGKVDFGEASASNTPRAMGPGAGGAYSMYRRPTDKMEAAVAVQVGRTLDVNG